MTTRIQLRRDSAANWTTANPTLAAGEAGVETDTSKLKLGDGATAWADLAYIGGGDTSGLLPIADPTGVTVETVTPDPVSGTDAMKVLTFPADCAALAIKLEGDDFPRWLLCADARDGLYLGDGTTDPFIGDAYMIVSGGKISFGDAVFLHGAEFQGDATFSSGPVLLSPDTQTPYRLVVAEDGTLSTELVT